MFKSYSAQHGLALDIDIREKDSGFIITISKHGKKNLFHNENSYKLLSHDEFLRLNENEIKNIIIEMVNDPDDFPHPGSGITHEKK